MSIPATIVLMYPHRKRKMNKLKFNDDYSKTFLIHKKKFLSSLICQRYCLVKTYFNVNSKDFKSYNKSFDYLSVDKC